MVNWVIVIQYGLLALFFGFMPRILEAIGLFKWMGSNPYLDKFSRFLGSKDPAIFYNYLVVALIVLMIFNGWHTQTYQTAFECQEVKNYVTEVRDCALMGKVPQFACTAPIMNGKYENGTRAFSPTPSNVFVETTTNEKGETSKTPNSGVA